MACWRQGRWHFQRLTDISEAIRVTADEFALRGSERPRGDSSINLAFEEVTADLSPWPSTWRGALRVAQEDFRGVVGIRVLERLGRPIPQIRHPPADIWRVAQGLQGDVYTPSAQPDPDDLEPIQITPPTRASVPQNADYPDRFFFDLAGNGSAGQPGQVTGPPVPNWEFAAATALVLAPWAVRLDQKLPQAVRFTAEDVRSVPGEPCFQLEIGRPPPPAKPTDPRLDLLQEAWATLFDLSQECLNLDGYDLDNSVVTRMLIDTTAEPIRGFTVERAGSMSGLMAELAGWIEELDGELSCDVAALRVQTVELDPPRPPFINRNESV